MPTTLHITDRYRDTLRAIGLDTLNAVFTDSRLRVWRDLEDRDNSTLDATLPDGQSIRLHVKRDKRRRREPMALEARGISLLESAGVPSAPLVAWGERDDGRTFVITENLDGYLSADRLMETDVDRGPVLMAMTDVAAKLHNAKLHHRDLYANHFYMKADSSGYQVRLIDTARVRPIPWLLPSRWIVKDVGQLIFSVKPYADESVIDAMIARYIEQTGTRSSTFRSAVMRKAAWIDRHDRALRAKKPERNLRLVDGN